MNDKDQISINRTLRKLRESKDLTQSEVADKLGVNVTTIVRWETDGISIGNKQIKKLAELYDVSVTDIFNNVTPSLLIGSKSVVTVSVNLDGSDKTLLYWMDLLRKMNEVIKSSNK
ncbi:MAG: helix-turn-helix transcriptional regulator [Cytophagales bacterium]|jgi:transcriptional regulator with XRE-family HTH domain|nr:helix-turn-helix transcriptional regulator [Cytophagales bacterium]MCA6370757.1 helix-turn-helix transcriptional regulator [Cytophagales bacterium]MCA6385919.1 helix-turn-helix transcriptional regulator [Cytophagales bacterium]